MTKTKTKAEKATKTGKTDGAKHVRNDEFRAAMTHLAALMDSASKLAGEILDRHAEAVDYYSNRTDVTAVGSVAACLADDLRSSGAAGYPD